MTTPATERKAGPYSGNDSQTEFPFTFRVFSASNVQVVVSLSGIENRLVLDTDYSVAINADQSVTPGGTVTYPLSGPPLAEGNTLAIVGALNYAQTLTLPSGGNFSPSAIEAALDRTVMLAQQLKEEVDRAVKVNVTSGISPDALLAQMAEDVADAAQAALDAETARNVALGAETVAVDAAGVAVGAKNDALAALASVPSEQSNTIASDHTVTASEHGFLFVVNASTGGKDVTAPNSADTAPAIDEPFTFWVKKDDNDGSTNTVRIVGQGTDTVNGAAYYEITKAGAAVKVVLDEGVTPHNWNVLEFGAATGDAFPLGAILPFELSAAPNGWADLASIGVLCASYPDYTSAAYIGDANNATADSSYRFNDLGNPSGTRSTTGAYIRLPPLTDRVIRMAGTHGVAGTLVDDAMQGHRHAFNLAGVNGGSTATLGGSGGANVFVGATPNVLNPTTDGANGTPRTADETRGKSYTARIYCVKVSSMVAFPSDANTSAILAGIQAQNALISQINSGTWDFEQVISSWAAGTVIQRPHGLGVEPAVINAVLRCKAGYAGYAIGEEFPAETQVYSGGNYGGQLSSDVANITYVVAAQGGILLNKSSKTWDSASSAYFDLVLRAKKGTTLTGGGSTSVMATDTVIAQGLVDIPHALGKVPTSVDFAYHCANASQGFNVGDYAPAVPWPSGISEATGSPWLSSNGFQVVAITDTLIRVKFAAGYSSTKTVSLLHKTTGVRADVLNTDWRITARVS